MILRKQFYELIFLACLMVACSNNSVQDTVTLPEKGNDTVAVPVVVQTGEDNRQKTVNMQQIQPQELVDFAESLVGVPYKYATSDPNVGFDCSGFISYVYNHFNIDVPRSSVDFTNLGTEIPLSEAKRGDLILFTGTDSTISVVGHMGIVTDNWDSLHFIHATSGKQYAVTVTPLNDYYMKRFVKITRL